jgi:hypothetical protein
MGNLMQDARLADALARLNEHHTLHLPLRRGDLLGRLVLRFLWRRHLKWQLEVNLAARDAIGRIDELTKESPSAFGLNGEPAPDLTQLVRQEQLRAELDKLHRTDQTLTAGLNQRLYSQIGTVRTELSDLRLQLTERVERTDGIEARLRAVEAAVADLAAEARELRLRNARLDVFLDKVRAALPAGVERAALPAPPDRASLTELAVAELLDGPVDRTRSRRAAYLPVIERARAGGAPAAVLDMVPGRGEWFELLRSIDVEYLSGSPNPLVVKHCAELGCQMSEVDTLDLLAVAPPRSLGGVTAFRYAERLDPTTLERFVELAATALAPGGALLVETPNVGGAAARDFHLDPQARRPVHPTLLRFLVEAAGFTDVEIRYPTGGPLSGWPADLTATAADTADRYCLVAWR